MSENSKEQRNKEIVEYYLAGHSAEKTGVYFHLSRTAVQYILKQTGVKCRPSGYGSRPNRRRKPLDIDALIHELEKKGAL